jgi:sialic acid synthase SpsE
MSTAYDVNSVQLLESIGVERYKIASADIVNKPLLKSVAETNKPVILSTGMATLGEIERAVNFLNGSGCNDLTLFHCISCYPAEPEQINLKFMKTLNKAFDVPVGFSDHTLETCIPAVAASHGAVAVEKHFTLDRDMKGPDHLASLEPAELSKMVNKIRDVESAMGSASQATVDQEEKNATLMRRSLHSRRPLSPGETIDREDIKIVRPSNGIDPWSIDDVVGSELKEGIDSDEAINWSSLHRY